MYQFDLGWTTNDGVNIFALGWLSRIVANINTIIPRGGMMDADDVPVLRRLKKKQTQRNIRNLFTLMTLFLVAQEDGYVGRQENETDETD